MTEDGLIANSPFLLGDDMGHVHPCVKHQFGSYDYDKQITNAIAMAIANEMAFDELLLRKMYDWLPEVHRKIEENWLFVEALLVETREIHNLKVENMS